MWKSTKNPNSLPMHASLPPGTVMKLNGIIYECHAGGWGIIQEEYVANRLEHIMSVNVEVSSYNENIIHNDVTDVTGVTDATDAADKNLVVKRGRGRPRVEKKSTREPSSYNLFIKEHMLNGDFTGMNSNDRLAMISKLYRATK